MRHDLLNDVINQIKNASQVGFKTIEIRPAKVQSRDNR